MLILDNFDPIFRVLDHRLTNQKISCVRIIVYFVLKDMFDIVDES